MLAQLGFILLAAVNIAAYFLMWLDKQRAIKNGAGQNLRRISENTFFLLSLLGGFLAIFFAMQQFRHKTKHPSFYFVVIFSAAIWLFVMPYMYVKLEM